MNRVSSLLCVLATLVLAGVTGPAHATSTGSMTGFAPTSLYGVEGFEQYDRAYMHVNATWADDVSGTAGTGEVLLDLYVYGEESPVEEIRVELDPASFAIARDAWGGPIVSATGTGQDGRCYAISAHAFPGADERGNHLGDISMRYDPDVAPPRGNPTNVNALRDCDKATFGSGSDSFFQYSESSI